MGQRIEAASTLQPTRSAIAAASSNPERFFRYRHMALEVLEYSSGHGGQLPRWAWDLDESAWRKLSVTLREIEYLEWMRRVVTR